MNPPPCQQEPDESQINHNVLHHTCDEKQSKNSEASPTIFMLIMLNPAHWKITSPAPERRTEILKDETL